MRQPTQPAPGTCRRAGCERACTRLSGLHARPSVITRVVRRVRNRAGRGALLAASAALVRRCFKGHPESAAWPLAPSSDSLACGCYLFRPLQQNQPGRRHRDANATAHVHGSPDITCNTALECSAALSHFNFRFMNTALRLPPSPRCNLYF